MAEGLSPREMEDVSNATILAEHGNGSRLRDLVQDDKDFAHHTQIINAMLNVNKEHLQALELEARSTGLVPKEHINHLKLNQIQKNVDGQLEDFAKRTKGTNITIVAQAAFADTDQYDSSGEPVVKPDTKYRLELYVVKDGEIKNVSNSESKGYGNDLKDLLAYACKNQPAKHMALIMDSHGTGNEGLLGDTGEVSVDQFVQGIREGLKGSGHEKLDMLDFDACLMAENGAVAKIRNVTDQMVASAETESIYNGQNYLDPIARLFDKPDADGFALARDIVAQTHRDMQDWEYEDGPTVVTLSHINLRQYDDFRKSLDRFGDQLVASLQDAGNKGTIEAAIDSAQKYGKSGILLTSLFGEKLAGKHRTDLKEFTESVLAAVDNGEIKDPDRSLKRAAQEVLNQRSLLVDSYHGEDKYARAGGLAVFLPGKNLRNVEKEAALYTSAGRLCDMTDAKRFTHVNSTSKSRDEFLSNIKAEVFWTHPHLLFFGTAGVDKELNKLDRLTAEFAKAKNTEERRACFKQLHQASIELANTEPFKIQYQEELAILKDKVAKVFKVNGVDDSNGWSRFRLKLILTRSLSSDGRAIYREVWNNSKKTWIDRGSCPQPSGFIPPFIKINK